MKSQVTTKIIIDTRRPKKDGLYPVKMRVTFKREQKYIPVLGKDQTALNLTVEDFDKIFGEKPRGEFRALRDELDMALLELKQKITTIPVFSFEQLDEKLFGKKVTDTSNVVQLFERMIDSMISDERLSTADGYRACLTALRKRHSKIQFNDITPAFLKGFHKDLLSEGKSISTVGIYMRYLRAVFNEAISLGLTDRDLYPFGREKGKYQTPSSLNVKKALTKEELKAIVLYKPESENEGKARDFWLLSYLCNGMNPKDIALLTFGDIDFKNKQFSFYRSKTSNRMKSMMKIEVAILPATLDIIQRWGNPMGESGDYVFPIFEKGMDALKRKRAKEQWLRFMNRNTKKLGIKLGFNFDLTTIVARHSFATMMMQSGSSQAFIQQSMGHSSPTTTNNYLSSFNDDTRQKQTAMLLDFE